MGYCIFSFQKIKSHKGLETREKHNKREYPLKNVDMELTNKNESLIPEYGLSYTERWNKRIHDVEMETHHKVKIRKNAVLALDVILTFSKDSDVDIYNWKQRNMDWLSNTFGIDNIIAAELHVDETTPHIHAIVVPINDEGRLCSKDFIGGRAKMFKLQDSYARVMAPLGLQRGERYTRSSKKDLYKFYSALNKALEEPIPEKDFDETMEQYIERIKSYVEDLKTVSLRENLQAQRKVEVAQARVVQFWEKYKNAVELQNSIEENMDENKDAIDERMQTYINIEKAVPRKTLDKVLKTITNKYPAEEAIRSFSVEARRSKKKKKKKLIDTYDI